MNGFEKTQITQNFPRALEEMKIACNSDEVEGTAEAKFHLNKKAQGNKVGSV